MCCKNIAIQNTAHFVTADYMDLSAREAFPIVFPSDCNQQTLRQVCSVSPAPSHSHSETHTHSHINIIEMQNIHTYKKRQNDMCTLPHNTDLTVGLRFHMCFHVGHKRAKNVNRIKLKDATTIASHVIGTTLANLQHYANSNM